MNEAVATVRRKERSAIRSGADPKAMELTTIAALVAAIGIIIEDRSTETIDAMPIAHDILEKVKIWISQRG